MTAFGVCAFAIAASLAQVTYDPDAHAGALVEAHDDIRFALEDARAGRVEADQAARELGATLGRVRRNQVRLTAWLVADVRPDPGKALRLVRMAGLVDAYAATAILFLSSEDPTSSEAQTWLESARTIQEQLDQAIQESRVQAPPEPAAPLVE